MALFEPGSGSQVHDFNGGILASGPFWTQPADDGVRFSREGRRVVLDVENVDVIDSVTFGSGSGRPGTVTMHIEWRADGPTLQHGSGGTVPPTGPAAFFGQLAVAESTAVITRSEFGFSFRANRDVNTTRTTAEIGRERNGNLP